MKHDLRSLRQNATTILRLPEPAQKVVDRYMHISVGGAQIPCPYHINPGLRSLNRALLGKGRPQEIEAFARRYFEARAMQVDGDPVRLRAFLQACGLGIDCSGFATWVLNAMTEDRLGRSLWACLKFPHLRAKAVSKLRPVENISARLLTGRVNATPVNTLEELRPGDLIRAANWHHVLVIVEVGLGEAGEATYFQYAQSSCMYGEESGVRTGYAVITKPQASLLEQLWFDNYRASIVEELIAEGGEDSRVVRLKVLSGSQK